VGKPAGAGDIGQFAHPSDAGVDVMAIAILDPTNGSIDAASGFVTAPRPVTLHGQTFGIMANGLGDSEIMFDALYATFAETDGLSDATPWTSRPPASLPCASSTPPWSPRCAPWLGS
jgi:hypothetical protein